MDPILEFQERKSEIFLFPGCEEALMKQYQPTLLCDGGKILDIGSGTGIRTKNLLATYFIDQSPEIIGVDKDSNMIQFANDNYNHKFISYVDHDICSKLKMLKFENKFDLATSFYSFHWMPNSEAVLTNVHAYLKKGGSFILVYTTHSSLLDVISSLKECCIDIMAKQKIDWILKPIIEPEACKKLMEDLGFNVIHCEVSKRKVEFENKQQLEENYDIILNYKKSHPELTSIIESKMKTVSSKYKNNGYDVKDSSKEIYFRQVVIHAIK